MSKDKKKDAKKMAHIFMYYIVGGLSMLIVLGGIGIVLYNAISNSEIHSFGDVVIAIIFSLMIIFVLLTLLGDFVYKILYFVLLFPFLLIAKILGYENVYEEIKRIDK